MVRGLPVEPNARDDHALHHREHMAQRQALEAEIDEYQQQGGNLDSDDGRKMRLTAALLMAHIQATAIFIQQITGKEVQPGQPQQENTLRAQMGAAFPGGGSVETPAEVGGQPLSPGGVEPAGQGGIAGNIARGG